VAEGLELVQVSGGGLPSREDFDRTEETLRVLRDQSDTGALHSTSIEAELLSRYYLRNQCKQEADGCMRLKVIAEAQIGRIDVAAYPRSYAHAPLVIGGNPISSAIRSTWRLLGVGDMRGMLPPLLDELAADPDREIATGTVRIALSTGGAMWVDPQPLLAAFKRSELSAIEVARRTGPYNPTIQSALGRKGVLNYPAALALAEVLGVDPTRLRPARKNMSGQATRQRKQMLNAALIAGVAMLQHKERVKVAMQAKGNIALAESRLRLAAEAMYKAASECATPEARDLIGEAYDDLRRVEDRYLRAVATEYGATKL
jgi:hypothetical protein